VRRWGFQLVGLLLVATALAQDVPPPPKPQDEGPSLEVTMKFLQDKLPGKVNYKDFSVFPNVKLVQEIVVMPAEQLFKKNESNAGHPELSSTVDPPVFALVVKSSNGEVFNPFWFDDETLAHRVAKALLHAVELCGGGNKEPF
jgi:hypothetical protein